MNFRFEHPIAATPADVAAALLDEGFQDSLKDLGPLADRRVLSQGDEDGFLVRRTRCVLGIDMGAARKFVGDADPAWVEVAVWHPEEMQWVWHVEPEVAADLLQASGRTSIVASGEEAVRKVEGSVKVKVPFYGGRVERWVVDGLRRAYDEEAQRLSAYLAVDTA